MPDPQRSDAESESVPMQADDLVRLFDGIGRPVSASAQTPFLLAGDAMWLVRHGQVDVFSVRSDGERAVGTRTHLVRLEEGAAFFGLGVTPHDVNRRLLAVGAHGTELVVSDASTLSYRASHAGLSALFDQLTESWVEALCAGMARDVLIPKQCLDLVAGGEVEMDSMTSARPSPHVCWIKHLQGSSLLLGREELTVNGHLFVPLSRRTWLQAREPARALLLKTDALPDGDDWWRGLARLHELTLRHAELVEIRTEAADGERIRKRTAARMAGLRSTCVRLAAAMHPGMAATGPAEHEGTAAADSADQTLVAACRLVGNAMAVSVREPARHEGAPPPRDPLMTILRASRLRARTVALRDDWWRGDAGPLLGWTAEDKRPIALLPGPGGYVVHDPMRRSVERVTAARAQAVGAFAHAFYRPFPDTTMGVKQLLRFGIRGCGGDLIYVVLMGLAGAILAMVPAIVTGTLFNSVIPGAQRPQLVQITAVLIACALASTLCNLQRGIAMLRIQARMGNQIQAGVWDRLLSLPFSFFRPFTAGSLAVRASAIDAIHQVVSGATVNALMGGIFSLGTFGLMFYYSPAMAWWGAATIATSVLVTGVGAYYQIGYQRAILTSQAKTSGLVLQLLTSVGKLRVAGADVPAFSLWGRGFGFTRALQFKTRSIGNWVSAFNAAFPVLAYVFIFWAAQPQDGKAATLRTGDFLAFLSAFSSCLAAVLSTSAALLAALTTIPLYEQAEPILKAMPEVDGDKTDPGSLTGEIEIQHAVFRYSPDGPLVLRDVTIHISPGEFVAFVGPSGSGKSTLLRLLLGFDPLESGSIYYDGQELAGLDVQAVRRQIGVVMQSARLMTGDILTNIVGSGSATLEEAWEAARMAGLADDIKQMPMGMHTVISEGGGTLSGGQRQRLMIARAVVNRPRILLFDEATSALDNRTQAIVSASLERLQATRIVVAHRLSTIVNADRICVIERGRLVEMGKHHELMARNGLYAALASRQIT